MTRYFIWPVNAAIVGALALLAACGATDYARARIEAAQARQKVCAAELRAVKARNPFADRYLLPADPCIALAVVKP